jgi:hypothetical protein
VRLGDHFDTALLISADSDLTTPVSVVRAKFPGKKICFHWRRWVNFG